MLAFGRFPAAGVHVNWGSAAGDDSCLLACLPEPSGSFWVNLVEHRFYRWYWFQFGSNHLPVLSIVLKGRLGIEACLP